MAQSIIRMLQYGSEFFVKYQFKILSNGFFISHYFQNRCKISANLAKNQIIIEFFHDAA